DPRRMDFFDRQEAAKRNTTWMVVLFVLAVAGVVGSVYLAVLVALQLGEHMEFHSLWVPPLFIPVSVGTLAVIAAGAAWKMSVLREGGAAVARALGGVPVAPDSRDPYERRLLNVVEEMAI